MTRFILLRHGQVEGITPPRFRGRRDLDLSDLGRRQAAAAAHYIAAEWRPAVIYSSPLRRCLQTAEPLARALHLGVATLDDLNDLDFGNWQWLTHEEARAREPVLFERWLSHPQQVRFPGGESLQDLFARAANVLRLVLERHVGLTVVLVTHDSVTRALLLETLGQAPAAYWQVAQDPCGVSEVLYDGERSSVRRLNETQHLAATSRSAPPPA
jgi:probable phosphoglycerate mutase